MTDLARSHAEALLACRFGVRAQDITLLPKPNGYRSLHTTAFSACGLLIEGQVRTHAHAESGGASHLRYKELQAMEARRG